MQWFLEMSRNIQRSNFGRSWSLDTAPFEELKDPSGHGTQEEVGDKMFCNNVFLFLGIGFGRMCLATEPNALLESRGV
jgi:hypothetical protein